MSYNVASILCWSLGDWSCPFFHNGEQVGGGNSLRAVGAGLLFLVSAQLSGGGGLGDGKVPKALQVTWAVCREHLCPEDAESVPLTPLPFSPWGLESPFPTKLVPPTSPRILAFSGASAPLRQRVRTPAAWLSPSLPPKPGSGTQLGYDTTKQCPGNRMMRTDLVASPSSLGQFICPPR